MTAATDDRPAALLRWAVQPAVAVGGLATLSFVAWLLPAASAAGKGFQAAPPTVGEWAWTVAAYVVLSAGAGLGFWIGRLGASRFSIPSGGRLSLKRTEVWDGLSWLAAIGVAAAVIKIVSVLGIGGCLRSLGRFTANDFKEVLYDGYSMGPLSLRYVAVLSAAVAIFRWLAFREWRGRTWISLGLVLITALISSRLSIVAAVTIGVSMYVWYPEGMGRRPIGGGSWVAGGLFALLVLGGLTLSRTYTFYQSQGTESPIVAVASEVQRYLAAPFHGSIVAVNNPQRGGGMLSGAGIDGGLTTNSSLWIYAARYDDRGVPLLVAVVFLFGIVCGSLRRFGETYLVIGGAAVQVCHIELWRLPLYHSGFFYTLIGVAIFVPLVVAKIRLPAVRLVKVSMPVVRVRLN